MQSVERKQVAQDVGVHKVPLERKSVFYTCGVTTLCLTSRALEDVTCHVCSIRAERKAPCWCIPWNGSQGTSRTRAGAYRGRAGSLSPAQVTELPERVEAGVSKTVLAKDYGVSRETVYAYLRAAAPARAN